MRCRATRLGKVPRILLPNLCKASGNLSLAASWSGSAAATGQTVTFTATGSAREQFVTISGGTANKIMTVAALVSTASGTKKFRFKNTHGSVVDNFSGDLIATTSPQIFTFTVTNSNNVGNGGQFAGVINSTDGSVGSIIVHAIGMFIGSYSAQQIVDCGGIQITN